MMATRTVRRLKSEARSVFSPARPTSSRLSKRVLGWQGKKTRTSNYCESLGKFFSGSRTTNGFYKGLDQLVRKRTEPVEKSSPNFNATRWAAWGAVLRPPSAEFPGGRPDRARIS